MDTQLLNILEEELSLKRKLVEQLELEKSEEDLNSDMNNVFKSMEDICSCIQQTVGILALCQPTANTLSATIFIPFYPAQL